MVSDRTILVIGGAGYVGSVLVGHLLRSGYRVRVLDALLYGNGEALTEYRDDPSFSFVRGDFRDHKSLDDALTGTTDIVMLAALVGDPLCRKYPELAREINDIGTRELIDRLQGKKLRRFVFMSTCSNYGLRETDEPADEHCRLDPRSLYAETKVAIEGLLLDPSHDLDFVVTIMRGATAYGLSLRMRFDLTVNEFTRELSVGNELLVYDAETWRPYCHLDDFALAITTVLQADPAKVDRQVFNLGRDGENLTKRMLVEHLQGHIPNATVKYREGAVDPRNYRVSFAKIESVLGFRPRHSVYAFVPQLVAAIRNGRFADYDTRPGFYRNQDLDDSSLV